MHKKYFSPISSPFWIFCKIIACSNKKKNEILQTPHTHPEHEKWPIFNYYKAMATAQSKNYTKSYLCKPQLPNWHTVSTCPCCCKWRVYKYRITGRFYNTKDTTSPDMVRYERIIIPNITHSYNQNPATIRTMLPVYLRTTCLQHRVDQTASR